MRPFAYQRADTPEQAVRRAHATARSAPAAFLAGGTTLVDLMRLGSMRPEALVDINDLARDHGLVRAGRDSLHLGGLVRMAEAADHPDVVRDYPVIAQSLSLAAMQWSDTPSTACGRFKPPMAWHPDPGARLLQAGQVGSRK